MPFDKSARPYDGDGDITSHSGAQLVQTNLASLIYGLRQGDGGGLLLDALSMSESSTQRASSRCLMRWW